MTTPTPSARYSPRFIALHWLMAALMLTVYVTMEFRHVFEKGSVPREAMKYVHFVVGLTILALIVVRIVARFKETAPAPDAMSPRWQTLAASAAHFALYVLMLVMPILGWFLVSAKGGTVSILGLTLPALVEKNEQLAETFKALHYTISDIGLIVIAVHIGGALVHHVVYKDRTLARMMPAPSAEAPRVTT
ncbi:MAG: cytochrome b [Hyphomicrobium sp.]